MDRIRTGPTHLAVCVGGFLVVVHQRGEQAGQQARQREQNRCHGKAGELDPDQRPVPVQVAQQALEHPGSNTEPDMRSRTRPNCRKQNQHRCSGSDQPVPQKVLLHRSITLTIRNGSEPALHLAQNHWASTANIHQNSLHVSFGPQG